MTRPLSKLALAQSNQLVAAPQLRPNIPQDLQQRNFGLPVVLHTAIFGLFMAFLAITAIGFASREMILPMAVCAIFTAAFYIVPMAWARMKPETNTSRAMTMGELERGGIMTYTGWCSGRDAAVQMLILPTLVMFWGIAVVTIAATV